MIGGVTPPKDLDMDRWWKWAACLGQDVEKIKRESCWSCACRWECLWSAIAEDDRIGEHALFMRGGMTGASREYLFYKNHRDVLVAFVKARIESENLEDLHERKRKARSR